MFSVTICVRCHDVTLQAGATYWLHFLLLAHTCVKIGTNYETIMDVFVQFVTVVLCVCILVLFCIRDGISSMGSIVSGIWADDTGFVS